MSGPTYRRTWAKWRERNTGNYDEAIRYARGGYLDHAPEIVSNMVRTDEPVAIWETVTHTWTDFRAAIERATHG